MREAGTGELVATPGVLSTSPRLRYITFSALYTAQGIPEGLTFFAIPAWLALNNVSAAAIGGYLAVIVLPWSFKLFAGPLMDRWSYLPMGRRRPWVLFGQVGLVFSFLSMTLIPDPVNNILGLSIMGFIVSFFGAFQDVATDGMAVDIIPVEQQSHANGLMWGAKVLGTSASLTTGTWLINHMGFSYAVVWLSVMVFLIMLLPLLLRERPGEKRLPWEAGGPSPEAVAMKVETWREVLFTLKNAFVLRGSLVMAVAGFAFCIGIGYMDALLPVFTIQALGWTNDAYSNVLAGASVAAALAAMGVAGWLVRRVGMVRIMSVYFLLFLLIPATVALTKEQWLAVNIGTWTIASYMTIYTFLMVAYLAVSMILCWKRVAATQFTLYMAIGNMGRAVGASLLGPARERFDWAGMFFAFGAFMLLAFVVVRFLHLPAHQVSLDRLEREHREQVPPDLGGARVPR